MKPTIFLNKLNDFNSGGVVMKKIIAFLLVVSIISTVVYVSGCLGGNTNSNEKDWSNISAPYYTKSIQTNTESSTTLSKSTTTTSSPKESKLDNNVNDGLVMFYIYGIHTCPHCQAMKERITKFYGTDHLIFYDLLEKNQTILTAFNLLSKITHSEGVPQVGIFYNNTLKAVIVGEFGDDYSFKDTVNQYFQVVDYYEKQHPNQTALFMILPSGAMLTTNKTIIKELSVIFTDPEKAVEMYGKSD